MLFLFGRENEIILHLCFLFHILLLFYVHFKTPISISVVRLLAHILILEVRMCDVFCRRLQHLYRLCHGNQISSGHILCVLHFLIWLQYSCYIHFSLILLFLSELHLLLLLSHCHLDNYVPPLPVKWSFPYCYCITMGLYQLL